MKLVFRISEDGSEILVYYAFLALFHTILIKIVDIYIFLYSIE